MEQTSARKILIVEDEAPAAMALSGALEQEGYEVMRAPDGEAGLKMSKEFHPDMILADLKMPGMGGLEMIRELRKDEWGKTARVIILTNLTDMESLQAAMSEEAFHYFVKGDTSMAKIVETVKAQLARA